MNRKMVRHLEAYRKQLINEYAALVDREKRDNDIDAGEEAKRLIRDIQELKELVGLLQAKQ